MTEPLAETDRADALAWLDDALLAWHSAGLARHPVTREGPQRPLVRIGERELVNFGSNDYLNLASDPRVMEAAAAAIASEGWGAGASPLVTGRSRSLARLETALAQFECAEAALVFPTGFAANAGTIAALVGPGDAIYSDECNHASLIDGCRMSRAAVHIYRHCDVEHLSRALAEGDSFARRLIVTDSVFSMDGDLAPLAELSTLARQSRSMLMVDEAHATGVYGAGGSGLCEAAGVEQAVHVRVGTLSKALGSLGGFVAGSEKLIEWLMNRARPQVFSTALPAAAAAAASAALEIVQQEPARRRDLLSAAGRLRRRLADAGWEIAPAGSQIIPLILGDAGATMQAASELRAAGYLVPGIRPPSVAKGHSLLRISLTCGHTTAMIDGLVVALANLRLTRP